MDRGNKELFSGFLKPRPSFATRIRTSLSSARGAARPFSFYIILSGLFHLGVFWLFLSADPLRIVSGGGTDGFSTNIDAYRRAAALMDAETPGETRLAELGDEDILALLSGLPALDPRFTKKERTEILLNFLAGLSDEDLLSLLSGEPGPASDGAGIRPPVGRIRTRVVDSGPFSSGGPALYRVDPSISRRLAMLRYQEKFERAATEVRGGYVRVDGGSGIRDIPSDYFFRDCPYEEMAAVGAGLFAFVSGFPDIQAPGIDPRTETSDERQPVSRGGGSFRVILVDAASWSQKSGPDSALKTLEPLALSAEERMAVLDDLMALPEEKQFVKFVTEYLDRYDPDQEDLAHLAREFMTWNQSAVFIVASRFSAAFDFVEKLYFNKRVQGYLETYARKNRTTRTGREILSVLAGLLDFEKRTLGYLFDAYETAVAVLDGKERRTEVLNPRAKALVIVKTLDAVMEAMVRSGIRSQGELLDLYESREIELLRSLADSGGETRDGALFSLGCLHWTNRRFESAVEAWNAVKPSYSRGSFVDMMELIEKGDYARIAPGIDEMIARSFGSSSQKHLERMVRFKKWSRRYQSPAGF
ncbi:MAG: hypothetical protein SCM96_11000 [Acidobacteriota bacterium]|nr:hypothetical protein [Acidobacteriota bacterium]